MTLSIMNIFSIILCIVLMIYDSIINILEKKCCVKKKRRPEHRRRVCRRRLCCHLSSAHRSSMQHTAGMAPLPPPVGLSRQFQLIAAEASGGGGPPRPMAAAGAGSGYGLQQRMGNVLAAAGGDGGNLAPYGMVVPPPVPPSPGMRQLVPGIGDFMLEA